LLLNKLLISLPTYNVTSFLDLIVFKTIKNPFTLIVKGFFYLMIYPKFYRAIVLPLPLQCL
jgi:hypothetical protein